MNSKYETLFKPLTLPNGLVLDNRFVLSPMITNSSTSEGFVTGEDIAYAERRSTSAPLQITGAAYIEPYGQLFEYGFGSYSNRHVPGLAKLAQAMKKNGNKAILQLTHAGRFAKISLKDLGVVYGPSEMTLHDPEEHTVIEMSERKIKHVIQYYADATRRAIRAGWDGVEISAAQRLLIQAFFSKFSNKRTDKYGTQNMENRSRLGVEVFTAVQKVIEEEGVQDSFILGFRGTPEEVRGGQVGYTTEEQNEFVDRLLEVADIDYYALASWGTDIYLNKARGGEHVGELVNKLTYDHFKGRLPIMATGGINTPDKALEAFEHADFVGMSAPFVTEPDFVTKLEKGLEEDIDLGINDGELDSLAIPDASFKDIVYMLDLGKSLSEETREKMRTLESNYNIED